MNVYELECGYIRHFVAAKDEQDAYAKGTNPERYPDIHYLPFTIRHIDVPGYQVTATPIEENANDGDGRRRKKAQ